MSTSCVICGTQIFRLTLTGRCPHCRAAEHAARLTASASDEVHSEDGRTFISKHPDGWRVVIEQTLDSVHPTREKARTSIRAWKVKREAARLNAGSRLPAQTFLALCKLLGLTDSTELRDAVRARGLTLISETTRFDILSEGGLDID